KTAWIAGTLIFIVGIPAALSAGLLGDVTLFGLNMFDLSDQLVSNILMPTGALLIAIFVVFKIPKQRLLEEIKHDSHSRKKIFDVWFLFIKYVARIAIIIVFLDVLGWLPFTS